MIQQGQPNLNDKLTIRLVAVRSRIQILAEKIGNAETPAVAAEQSLIEMDQLEYEEAFLQDALHDPPCTTFRLWESSVKPLLD